MIRRCVMISCSFARPYPWRRLVLMPVIIIAGRRDLIRVRDANDEIRIPKGRQAHDVFQVGRATPVRAIVSAGRGLPALPMPRPRRDVLEAVVPTACLGLGNAPGPGASDSDGLRELRVAVQRN